MTQDVGYRIKYHRQRNEITQSELSEGLISVSYLSKIENGVADPPEETIRLLCEKLNIEPNPKESKHIENLCNEWFVALFNKQIDQTHYSYLQIQESIETITDNSLLNLIEIHKLRYFLIHKKQYEADAQFKNLLQRSINFNDKELYYWLKFSGYYFFSNSSFSKALTYFQKAKKHVDYSFYSVDEEKYDLYYMIALSASYIKKTYIVFTYGSKALEHYQRKYHLKQAAQCHILLGITSLRTRDYESAIESYKLAEMIANTINNKTILATASQNIGNLYSILNKTNESIKYYKKSYNLREDGHKKVIPINSLIKEYYKIQDFYNAKIWLKIGHEIINQIENNSIYIYELKVYDQLINGINNNDFEHLLLNEAIPFINEKEIHHEKIPFLEILANYYFDNRRYKLAATYYRQALTIKNSL